MTVHDLKANSIEINLESKIQFNKEGGLAVEFGYVASDVKNKRDKCSKDCKCNKRKET